MSSRVQVFDVPDVILAGYQFQFIQHKQWLLTALIFALHHTANAPHVLVDEQYTSAVIFCIFSIVPHKMVRVYGTNIIQ